MKPIGGHYIPVTGSAWRILVAEPAGRGADRLFYGAYDGAVRCQRVDCEELDWEAPLGAFPFSIAAFDVNGDGRLEVFAATARGELCAIDADGYRLWQCETGLPMYCVCAGAVLGSGHPGVVCGGTDRRISVLSPAGDVLATHRVDHLVNRLCLADLDGDGCPEIVAMDGRNEMLALKMSESGLNLLWKRTLRVPDSMKNWENPAGRFFVFGLHAGDLDGDGRDEIVAGDAYFNKQAVMALSPAGKPMWLTDPVPWEFRDGRYTEFYSSAFVRVADVLPEEPGQEVFSVAGGLVRLFDRQGNLRGEALARVGFTDLAVRGRTLFLGSSPNGDDVVYRVDLDGDWQAQVESLERRRTSRRIGETLAELRRRALDADACPVDDGDHDVRMLGIGGSDRAAQSYRRRRDWLMEQLPYAGLRFVAGTKVIEPTPPLDENGEPWSEQRWRTDSINGTMTVEEIIQRARFIEEQRIPTVFTIGHSCMPFITLETARRMLEAAPNYLVGFLSAEDEDMERGRRYFPQWFGLLADLCTAHGGKRCITKNKNVWWMSAPATPEVHEGLFAGARGEVLGMQTEDSNSRTPEINLMARFGLWMAGLTGCYEAAIISDLFSFCRFHQWEYPKHGHPYLRLLVAHTVLGARNYVVRVKAMQEVNGDLAWSDIGREAVETFFHLLGKGLVFTPEREQVVGISPVGIAVHEPPQKWLHDGHNGHNPQLWDQLWMEDDELHEAVIPHNSCTWGMSPTPEHALQRVLLGKQRQFGYHVPATPYGPFAIVPARAGLEGVPGVREWWHTDGIYVWQQGGERLRGDAAGRALQQSFDRGARRLPFRPRGNAFFQTLQVEPGRYRIYAIDPGWLDPAPRDVTVSVQAEGDFEVRDMLEGREVTVEGGRFSLKVPAGALRIVEAVRR